MQIVQRFQGVAILWFVGMRHQRSPEAYVLPRLYNGCFRIEQHRFAMTLQQTAAINIDANEKIKTGTDLPTASSARWFDKH